MSRLAVRTPFNLAGPFVALKAGSMGGVEIAYREVFPLSKVEHIGERKLRLMFDGRWIDMASPEEIAVAGLVADHGALDPIATLAAEASRDAIAAAGAPVEPAPQPVAETPPAPEQPPLEVFPIGEGDVLIGTDRLPALVMVGENEMQLGRIVTSAFRAHPMSVADWNALSTEGRDEIILHRARAIGWTGEPLPPAPPQEPAQAPEEPKGTTTPPQGEAPPLALPGAGTEPGRPVSVYHEGFGRWYGRDGDGNKVGAKMTRAQAEATKLPVVDKETNEVEG